MTDMTERYHSKSSGLPDPEYYGDLYEDVPVKRLIAWVVDTVLIALIVALFAIIGLLIPLLFLPVLFALVGFVYRWGTIAAASATPGMRLMAIELRDNTGHRLAAGTAFLHTLGYTISVVTVPLQIVSIVLMLTTARRQGLTDLVLGTTALNRRVD